MSHQQQDLFGNIFELKKEKTTLEDFIPELVDSAYNSLILNKKILIQPSHPIKEKSKDSKKQIYKEGPRTTWLPGRGENNKDIMIICQSPSQLDIDNQLIYSDEAGFHLSKTLSQKVGVSLFKDCYVTSLVKYPIDNSKVPPADAKKLALPLILKEIEYIKPKLIICMGSSVFKTITSITAEPDEYYGNIIYSDICNTNVGIVLPPTTTLSAPEMEPLWVIDLKMMFNKHNPIMCNTSWEEQDRLPTHTINDNNHLAQIVAQHILKGIDTYSLDTEYDPKGDWLDAVCFKITISSEIDNIDIHLYEPKQGYESIFVPATIGKLKDLDKKYYTGQTTKLFFPEQDDYNSYLEHYPLRKKPLEVYIGDYKWCYQGTKEELVQLLNQLLCRPGNKVVGQNGRDDYKLMYRLGVNLLPYVVADTITLAKCIDDSAPLALESLSKQWLGAPSHKLELVEWLHNNYVGQKLPYVFVPRHIIDPYAVKDSRRTYDLYFTLLNELERQHQDALLVDEPSLKTAYFYSKMPEFFALLEMEIIGQPINIDSLTTCMTWYEDKRRALIKEMIDRVTKETSLKYFSPDSVDDVRYLLFEELGLRPLYATDGTPWDEVMELPPKERFQKKPAADKDTLKTLAAEHEFCQMLNTIRILGTIESNYLRRGARWQLKEQEDPDLIDVENFKLDAELKQTTKKTLRNKIDLALDNDGLTKDEYWKAFKDDSNSKSISQALNNNGYIYTAYFELLETHRLASKPNVSAISKGEYKSITKLLKESPPLPIRAIIEPHHNVCSIKDYLEKKKEFPDLIIYDKPKEERDWVIVESDWTAGEVWYLAVISEDPECCSIMDNPKRDIHSSMAKRMFPERIPQDMEELEIKAKFDTERSAAKPFVFGIPYGRGGRALVRQLNTEAAQSGSPIRYTFDQGEQFIQVYQTLFPVAWNYLLEQKARVSYPGYLVSPWGFKRRFPKAELLSQQQKAAFEREALNWQIQHGLAATMMEATKAYLSQKKIPSNQKMPFYLIDILHDATKYICHSSVLDEAIDIIHYTMDDGIKLPFTPKARLRHTVEVSYNWCGDAVKDISKLKQSSITWEEINKLVPTSAMASNIVTSLNPLQINPNETILPI